MSIKILWVGEPVGSPGVFTLRYMLKDVIKNYSIDFTVVQADSCTNGQGLGKTHAFYLHKLGVDVLCLGEHAFRQLDIVPVLKKSNWILRPANVSGDGPGRGWIVKEIGNSKLKVAVVNLIGQRGFSRFHADSPYTAFDNIYQELKDCVILIDFHAAMTAEKLSFAHYVDGKAALLAGSHTKVLTGDEKISSQGTAYISCCGRTGSSTGVLGTNPHIAIKNFRFGIPVIHKSWHNDLELQGIILELSDSGKPLHIERIRLQCKEEFHA
ncbi:MAG TPA: TIGR00282 family metallophosphoesterase [Spirochaetia bacterium]|nr:TIGR00282 family metallophosphoesterase [Spirochaetales bacterium]HRS65912.1 TIGR00282 family metallophosphoesterase [Spirochaetia bacterium]HRV29563.1 TIGR00282 family metallophosphoesterase [Spirochaetia bacterium]